MLHVLASAAHNVPVVVAATVCAALFARVGA